MESGRNPVRKTDFRPGGASALHGVACASPLKGSLWACPQGHAARILDPPCRHHPFGSRRPLDHAQFEIRRSSCAWRKFFAKTPGPHGRSARSDQTEGNSRLACLGRLRLGTRSDGTDTVWKVLAQTTPFFLVSPGGTSGRVCSSKLKPALSNNFKKDIDELPVIRLLTRPGLLTVMKEMCWHNLARRGLGSGNARQT